jgi:transposase
MPFPGLFEEGFAHLPLDGPRETRPLEGPGSLRPATGCCASTPAELRAPDNESPAKAPRPGNGIAKERGSVMEFYAGLDWAKQKHAVCVLDQAGAIQARFWIPHTAEGLRELTRRLTAFSCRGSLRIALERCSGLLVDTLLDAGFVVVPIHPNVVKASRPRYTASHGKTDPWDAYLLADLLRTDGHRFRPLRPLSDRTRALRALVRSRDDLVAERVALANQLRDLLESFWPGAVAIFAEVDSPISLAFLTRYPTPQHAQSLGEKRLAAFLVKNRYSGRRSVKLLLERLHVAPLGHTQQLEAQAKGELVLAIASILKTLVDQLKQLDASVEEAVSIHPAAPVFTSFPRIGRINAAQILSETGEDPNRFTSLDQLAAEAGVCPITYASGKHCGVAFRFACNKRLRRAFTTFAGNSRHASPWAASIYARARARGHSYPHAARVLARAWLRIFWRCWINNTPYDPTRHTAAARLAA